jgi:hypothetical protein
MEPTYQEQAPPEVAKPSQVIQVDKMTIQAYPREVVRGTVEEPLSAMVDAGAGRLRRAKRSGRTEACKNTRPGSKFDNVTERP